MPTETISLMHPMAIKSTDLIRFGETLLLTIIHSIDHHYGTGVSNAGSKRPDIPLDVAQTLALAIIAYKLGTQE